MKNKKNTEQNSLENFLRNADRVTLKNGKEVSKEIFLKMLKVKK